MDVTRMTIMFGFTVITILFTIFVVVLFLKGTFEIQITPDIFINAAFVIMIGGFWWMFAIPVFLDIPYLVTENYKTMTTVVDEVNLESGTIITTKEYGEKEIAIPSYRELEKGEKITIEYLPHTKIIMSSYSEEREEK